MKTLADLRKAKSGLAGQRWLVYGPPKIGKSTFASQAPGLPLFLDCEYGIDFLDARLIECASWATITSAIDAIARGGHDHKTIVIDTIDRFVALATEHVQGVLGIEHVGDAGYGKGYGRLREVVDAALYKLASGDRLVILISHDRVTGGDGKLEVTTPATSRREQVMAYVDVIGHVEYVDADAGARQIRFRGTTSVIAGARGAGGKPMLPAVMPLDWAAIQKHLAPKPKPETAKADANPAASEPKDAKP